MKSTTFLAELPPEAALIGLFVALLILGFGIKQKPKLTLTLLACSLIGWLCFQNMDTLNAKFQSLSQAQMEDRG